MERVVNLVDKLKQQLERNAPLEELLITAQMIHAELLFARGKNKVKVEVKDKAAVIIPFVPVLIPTEQNGSAIEKPATKKTEEKIKPEEKTIEVLQVDEKEIEEELAEIKRTAEAKNQMSAQARPVIMFDNDDDVPTLTHQSGLKDTSPPIAIGAHHPSHGATHQHESLNDKLKQTKIELGETLTETPIRDLKKAIGVNDRFLFINELFRGDEAMYERSIKTINNFSILPEAQYWIQRELKVKIGWKDTDEVVKQFDQLVKRRFT